MSIPTPISPAFNDEVKKLYAFYEQQFGLHLGYNQPKDSASFYRHHQDNYKSLLTVYKKYLNFPMQDRVNFDLSVNFQDGKLTMESYGIEVKIPIQTSRMSVEINDLIERLLRYKLKDTFIAPPAPPPQEDLGFLNQIEI